MPHLPATPSAPPAGLTRAGWLGVAALLGAIAAVWLGTLRYPFLFDDANAITDNPSIRRLADLATVLSPPNDGSGAAGRPLVNFSLALNYAISGESPAAYRLVNIAIHAIASLALFGLMRRTACLRWTDPRDRAAATPLALTAAALWALHPLQTESVTCVIQRTESLMGCLFLLTLYTLARAVTADARRTAWLATSAVCCLLGMATKEVMIAAPLLALLYDRTFAAGSFAAAWQRRRTYYLALAATALLLIALVLKNGTARGSAAGLGLGVSSWDYLLTQCRALVLYLRLSLWPHPLNADYGTAVVTQVGEVWLEGVFILALLGATTFALWRRPVVGFFGAWFFIILAPSSSVVPLITQTIAEHRMYLPLAALTTTAALGLFAVWPRAGLWPGLALAGLLALTSAHRNEVYCDPLVFWSDVLARSPDNARAHNNRGNLLSTLPGRADEAHAHFMTALRLNPASSETHYNLANLLAPLPGRGAEAIDHYYSALRLNPAYAPAHNNLANFLAAFPGRESERLAHYEAVIRLRPDHAEARNNLALLLAATPGREAEAPALLAAAIRLKPDYAAAHGNLANLLAAQPDRTAEAVTHYEIALRLDPASAEVHNNYANLLANDPSRLALAVDHYQTALRLWPDYAAAHHNLALLLAPLPGRGEEALRHATAAANLLPQNPAVHFHLARTLELFPPRRAEALHHYSVTLQLAPDHAGARAALARLQAAAP